MLFYLQIFTFLFSSVCWLNLSAQSQDRRDYGAISEDITLLPTDLIGPMDTSGLDSRISNILKNYYRLNFTSFEHWTNLQSIRLEGTISYVNDTISYNVFKKKPDYCKAVFYTPGDNRFVMCYDGQEAWQLNTLKKDFTTEKMPEKESLNFIRDAAITGHLLFPIIKGKKIELLGIKEVAGKNFFELQITLPDSQVIRSFLGILDFAEYYQITLNQLSGKEEITTNTDFRIVDGIRIPFSTILTVDGVQVYQSKLSNAQINVGVMPWMFSRSSSDYVP